MDQPLKSPYTTSKGYRAHILTQVHGRGNFMNLKHKNIYFFSFVAIMAHTQKNSISIYFKYCLFLDVYNFMGFQENFLPLLIYEKIKVLDKIVSI